MSVANTNVSSSVSAGTASPQQLLQDLSDRFGSNLSAGRSEAADGQAGHEHMSGGGREREAGLGGGEQRVSSRHAGRHHAHNGSYRDGVGDGMRDGTRHGTAPRIMPQPVTPPTAPVGEEITVADATPVDEMTSTLNTDGPVDDTGLTITNSERPLDPPELTTGPVDDTGMTITNSERPLDPPELTPELTTGPMTGPTTSPVSVSVGQQLNTVATSLAGAMNRGDQVTNKQCGVIATTLAGLAGVLQQGRTETGPSYGAKNPVATSAGQRLATMVEGLRSASVSDKPVSTAQLKDTVRTLSALAASVSARKGEPVRLQPNPVSSSIDNGSIRSRNVDGPVGAKNIAQPDLTQQLQRVADGLRGAISSGQPIDKAYLDEAVTALTAAVAETA
jgi:hypothetical protein